MHVSHFIARRYFKSKKSRNVINLITNISVVGITISTAALVILLSAFNGIEKLVVQLYSDFDASITIRSARAKTFNQDFLPIEKISATQGVKEISRAVEEVIILKNEDKWVHAKMIGVDTSFLSMSNMNEHIIDGNALLYTNGKPQAIFGAFLFDNLDGYIPMVGKGREHIVFNVPIREGKIRLGSNPINMRRVSVSARMNYNREVNTGVVLVPYELAKDLLEYNKDITALYVGINENADLIKVKEQLQQVVGDDFVVKTNFEKNKLIYQTSQTEKLIIYFILVFIFILSSFNLIASIAMLFIEKKEDISTLFCLGATRTTIFKIFLFQGLMIVAKGVFIGLLLGYAITFAQIYFELVNLPNAQGNAFPMVATWIDGVLIVASVGILGGLVTYFPSKILINRHNKI